MSLRENESLLNLHTWCTDVEYKRWLLTEYMASHGYAERLRLLLDIIVLYFENLFHNPRADRGLSLPHIKSRWTDDEFRQDPNAQLRLVAEFCRIFRTIQERALAFALFHFLFAFDKVRTDPDRPDRRADLEMLLMAAVACPAPALLDAAVFHLLSLPPPPKHPLEFRMGASVFIDLCTIVPDGSRALISLISSAPLFANFVIFCVSRKLANKLRAAVPLRSHHAANTRADGRPSTAVLESILVFLDKWPDLVRNIKNYEFAVPDLHTGEVRNFFPPPLSPVDDLAHVVIGYSLWFLSETPSTYTHALFEQLATALGAILAAQGVESAKPEPSKGSGDEGEEGEIEQGELIEESEESRENTDHSSTPARLACFLARMYEFGVVDDTRIVEVIERFDKMMHVFINAKAFTSSEAVVILKYLEKLSSFNSNLINLTNLLKKLAPN